MSQKTRHKISLDYIIKPANKYYHSGYDGFNHDAGSLAFGTDKDWAIGKTRRNKRPHKPLF